MLLSISFYVSFAQLANWSSTICVCALSKTTILYKLHIGEVLTTVPTIGFNVEKVLQNAVVL